MLAQAYGSVTANLLELIPDRRNNGSLLDENNASQRRQLLKFAISKLWLAIGISREAESQKELDHPGFKAWISTAPVIPSLLILDQPKELISIKIFWRKKYSADSINDCLCIRSRLCGAGGIVPLLLPMPSCKAICVETCPRT